MKIGIISDTHLGHPDCTLLQGDKLSGAYYNLATSIHAFSGRKPLDFLVLNGDVLDFSANTMVEALKAARPFFRGICRDKLARQIVYIPGNHDKRIWNAVEWETNIIGKLSRQEDPRKPRRTQPGVIDMKGRSIKLSGVARVAGKKRYGNLFLEGLFEKGRTLPILVVYPNLYIKTAQDLIMVTHGHMMDMAWVLVSELLGGVVKDGTLSLVEMEEFNAPFHSFLCTGVGHGGQMSELFFRIKKEAQQGKSKELQRAMDAMVPIVDKMIPLGLFEFLDNALLKGLKMLALFVANNRVEAPRFNEKYFSDRERRKRFSRYFTATCEETMLLDLAVPGKMVYGHTHKVIPASNPYHFEHLMELGGENLLMYNTGGWLGPDSQGGEILFIGEKGELSSEGIPKK